MTEALQVEATGETVGEAKWSALRELEKLQPGIDKAAVRFQVITEGERGLLGVGYAPARVIASVDAAAAAAPAPASEPIDESDEAADVREVLERILAAIGVRARIEIHEDEERLTATFVGRELGLLIGKHGQTIDAIQYLANAIVWRNRGDERKPVVVDAAGYRARRQASLDALATRSAEQAVSSGEPVELEPMTAVERKVVHVSPAGSPGRDHAERGHRAQPLRRDRPRLTDPRLERWLDALVATPGLTSVRDPAEARRVHVDEQPRRARDGRAASTGSIVDVGSGGGAPGIPLAAALPEREVTLLESQPAQVRVPGALDGRASEPARGLRSGGRAAGGRVRRRGGEGSCAACRSRPSGACRSLLREAPSSCSSARAPNQSRSPRSPSSWPPSWWSRPRACSCCASSAPPRPGSRAGPGLPENVRSPS